MKTSIIKNKQIRQSAKSRYCSHVVWTCGAVFSKLGAGGDVIVRAGAGAGPEKKPGRCPLAKGNLSFVLDVMEWFGVAIGYENFDRKEQTNTGKRKVT